MELQTRNFIKLTIILTYATIITADEHPKDYSITQLPNTGIFFERLHQVRMFTKQRSILSSAELTDFHTTIINLQSHTINLKMICQQLKTYQPDEACEAITKRISYDIIHTINNEHALITRHTRTKRALVNAGGALAKLLIGTMDSDDADEIYNQLRQLQESDKATVNVLNQQISLIKSNFEALATPVSKLEDETNNIKSKLSLLWQQVRSLEQSANDQSKFITMKSDFLEITDLVLATLTLVDRSQARYATIFNSLQNGKLHPYLFAHDDILKAIEGTSFDFDKNFITQSYIDQVTKVSWERTNNTILMKLDIALPSKTKYEAFQMYIIPIIENNHSFAINIDSKEDVIITDKAREQFMLTSHGELQKCAQITTNLTETVSICEANQAIFSTHHNKCIFRILSNPFKTNTTCRKYQIKPKNIMSRTASRHTWLFSTPNTISIMVKCPNTNELVELKGNGLLTFQTQCTVKTEEFEIPVFGSKPTKIKFRNEEAIQEYNVRYVSAKPESQPELNNKNAETQITNHLDHNEIFNNERVKIANFKDSLKTLQDTTKVIQHPHDVWTERSIIFGAFLVTAATAFVISKSQQYKKKFQSRRNKPSTRHTPEASVKLLQPSKPTKPKTDTKKSPSTKNTEDTEPEVIYAETNFVASSVSIV